VRRRGRLFVALCVGLALQTASADEASLQNAVRVEVEQLRVSGQLSIRGIDIASGTVLAEFYERRDFRPAWTTSEPIDSLLAAIEASAEEGFVPTDYHVNEVREARSALVSSLTDRQRAAIDILYTDSLMRLGYHFRFGKVNPQTLDTQWNFTREREARDPVGLMQQAIDTARIGETLRELFPRIPMYDRLRAALFHYREIAASGGWSQIPDGPTLKPGAGDVRLNQIASRLRKSGDLPASNVTFETYDAALEHGIQRFQYRHGLAEDGVLGPATLAALNVGVEGKLSRLRLSLERSRWVAHSVAQKQIVVNIAGFSAYLYERGEVVWQTRVQVGRTYHKTPVFLDDMKYVVLNPTWIVPYSIATKEILPKIKNQPDYFETRDFDIKNRDGNLVDHRDIDWSRLNRGNFGYTFVQRAGPNNALGLAKFIFPNEHAVYLHDTPSKSLFERAERAFSHGCIRIDRPLELAEILLRDKGWDRERIDANKKTKTVFLSTPLPVLIMYWTAEVTPDGTVRFFDDIYERDVGVLNAMNAPFKLDRPQV